MNRSRVSIFLAAAIVASAGTVRAEMEPGKMKKSGMESGTDGRARMMQEQNKSLARASVRYMAQFALALKVQAGERKDQIDDGFIMSAFSEMKRAFAMIERFQAAHVKTMDGEMQNRVKPMMDRMNGSLEAVRRELKALESEISGKRDLERIAAISGEILRHLDNMPGDGMPGGPGEMKDGKKRMMR